MEEALRSHDGVEVEAGEAPDQTVVRGDEVVDKVSVESDPVGAAHPLQTKGDTSVSHPEHVVIAVVEHLGHALPLLEPQHLFARRRHEIPFKIILEIPIQL